MKILQKFELPLVTIGIPVFNDEKYVSEAIADILSQTYSNLEIIISDNCSTDRTEGICREYASKDERIRYVRQESNIGQHGNFKYLLDHANGQYFMWAASDDRCNPEFIESLVESMEGDPNSAVAFCTYSEIDEDGRLLSGEYRFNFSGASSLVRIAKFHLESSGRRDAFFYGLFRRNIAANMQFTKWWWINKSIPMNLAYPPMSFMLAAGNYILSDSVKPLWFNRVHSKSKPRHSAEHSSLPFILIYLAFYLRKINQLIETEKAVINGSGSLLVGILIFPVITFRCLYDCLLQTINGFISIIRRLKILLK
jgi:glycosyltransferase involved in cell wall biosynthesis